MRNVTCHVTKRDTDRDMSRVTVHVSHATTTTPHYTKSLVAVVCGVYGSDQIQSNGELGAFAAPIGFGGKQ